MPLRLARWKGAVSGWPMSALGQERTLRQPDLAAIQFKQGENEHGRLESHKVYLSERLLYLLYVLPYRIKVPL